MRALLRLLALAAALLAPSAAQAQSTCPYIAFGAVLTAAQWQTCFTNKADASGVVSSISNADGSLTIAPNVGSVVASLNVGHANTWTATQTYNNSIVFNAAAFPTLVTGQGAVDASASNGLVLGGFGSANDVLFANKNGVTALALATGTATWTLGIPGASIAGILQFANATSGTIAVTSPTGALGTVTNTLQAVNDTFVYRATIDTLTNKTLASSTDTLGGVTAGFGSDAKGDLYQNGGASNVIARLGIGATNNVLIVSAGLAAWGQVALGSSAAVSGILTGTNGGTGVNNGSALLTFAASFTTTGAGAPTLAFPGSSFTYTFQGSSDTIIGRATTDTLTNKTLTSATDTLGAVGMSLGSDATGDIYYRSAGAVLARLAIGTSGQCLEVSAGIPSWQSCSSATTITVGTTTVTSGCTPGGTLINNAGVLGCVNTGPTKQVFTAGASGTYTTPAGVRWIKITIGGGGGGGGGGGTSGGTGTTGNNSCWNTSGAACTSSVYQAGGGAAGTNSVGGSGGTVSGSGTCDWSVPGGGGQPSIGFATASGGYPGGNGGSSYFGGDGSGGTAGANTGGAAASNSGGGGGGGGVSSSGTGQSSGGGGGAGSTCSVVIVGPAATYTYAVAATAGGGSAGTNGGAGGTGAGGQIQVEEHYTF